MRIVSATIRVNYRGIRPGKARANTMDRIEYIRTDKNGTKIYADWTCPRCGGEGESSMWLKTGKVCFRCGGSGLRNRPVIVKEYTDEYAAKLKARRQAKAAKYAEEHAEEIAAAKAEQERRDAEIAAQIEEERKLSEEIERKARGHFFGTVGQKVEIDVTYTGHFFFDSVYGGGTVYKFDTDDGAHLVWMTSGSLGGNDTVVDEGSRITIRATIKEHKERLGVEQTMLARLKVIKGGRPWTE